MNSRANQVMSCKEEKKGFKDGNTHPPDGCPACGVPNRFAPPANTDDPIAPPLAWPPAEPAGEGLPNKDISHCSPESRIPHTDTHTHILKLHQTTPLQSIKFILRFCTSHIHLRPVRSRVSCAAPPDWSLIPCSHEWWCAHRRASHHDNGFFYHGRRWRAKVWEAGKCRWCAGEQEQTGLFRHSHGHGHGGHSHSVVLFPWLRQPRELWLDYGNPIGNSLGTQCT